MEKHEKLAYVINYLKLKKVIKTQKEFAKLIVVDEPSVTRALQGNESYVSNVCKKTLFAFPEINPDYLLGDSEVMMKADAEQTTQRSLIDFEPVEEAKPKAKKPDELPIVPVQTFRSADTDVYKYIHDKYDKVNKLRISEVIKQTDLVVMTSNDSMMPAISPTDYLLVHKLGKNATITDGEVYYIDTCTRGGLIRHFTYDSEKDVYVGRAENSTAFPDAVVARDDVTDISAILCLMRFVMPSIKPCDHADQLRDNSAHIASLIDQLGKAGERVDKAGERTDKLLELLFNKMQ